MNHVLPDWRYEQIKFEVANTFKKCDINSIPISGFEIANKLGIIVVPYSVLSNEKRKQIIEIDEDGVYFKKKNDYYIYYNNQKPYGRINFTILHEIGHIVLNHTQHSKLAEAEANFFAKYAYVPPVLVDKYSNNKTALGIMGVISCNFGVSRTMVTNCFNYYKKWKNKFEQKNEYTNYELMIIEQFD